MIEQFKSQDLHLKKVLYGPQTGVLQNLRRFFLFVFLNKGLGTPELGSPGWAQAFGTDFNKLSDLSDAHNVTSTQCDKHQVSRKCFTEVHRRTLNSHSTAAASGSLL